MKYSELVKEQRVEKPKPVEVDRKKEWKTEKVTKYLICQKEFTVKYKIWERKKDLENIKKEVANFEGKMSIEVKR